MSVPENIAGRKRFALSSDVWAVVLSLLLALLVRVGVIRFVRW